MSTGSGIMDPSDRRHDSRLRAFLGTLEETQREVFEQVWDLQTENAERIQGITKRVLGIVVALVVLVAVGWWANGETRQDVVERLCERANATAQANLDFLRYDAKVPPELMEKARKRFRIERNCESFSDRASSPAAVK